MLRQPHFDTFRQKIRLRHPETIDTTGNLSDHRSRAVVSTLVVRAGLPVLFRASAASCDILVPYRLTRAGLPDNPRPKSEDMCNQAVLLIPPMTIFGNKSSSYHCCYRVRYTPLFLCVPSPFLILFRVPFIPLTSLPIFYPHISFYIFLCPLMYKSRSEERR